MIRAIFWLVLLINVVLFVLMKWGGALLHDESGLLTQPPLNPEKIKLLLPSAVEAQSGIAQTASAPLPAQPAPASATPPAAPASLPAPASATASAGTTTCLEWGEFSGSDLTHAKDNLAALKLGDRLTQRQLEHTIGYWVYLPPAKTHAETSKRIAQIKKIGVKQYFVVQEKGKWHNAISLGVFKSTDLAQKFLAHLKAQGIKSAAAGERKTRLKFTVFVLKNPDGGTLSKLTEWQKGYTGIEMKSIPCS